MKTVVVVPHHRDIREDDFSSLNSIEKNLPYLDVFFVCPEGVAVNNLLRSYNRFQVLRFPAKYFKSEWMYNHLLKKEMFYKAFQGYDYMLLVQTDALVIKDNLSQWVEKGYDFVGAPLFKGYSRPSPDMEMIAVGNGGFSLRRIEKFISVLEKVRYLPVQFYNRGNRVLDALKFLKYQVFYATNRSPLMFRGHEDIFWGRIVAPKLDWFIVPTPMEAVGFSFDAAPEYLFELNGNRLPFGCHQWRRFNPKFWESLGIK